MRNSLTGGRKRFFPVFARAWGEDARSRAFRVAAGRRR